MLTIVPLAALRDNYIFVLFDDHSRQAIVVDPGEARPVVEFLQQKEATLVAILNTHFHADHTGGNLALLKTFPGVPIYGGQKEKRIPGLTNPLQEGDELSLLGHHIRILDVAAHTRGHIAYYFSKTGTDKSDTAAGDLFSGDTIFGGTCGAIFEGTVPQMFTALNKIRSLPAGTRIWCAHEYTEMYVKDAIRLELDNEILKSRLLRVQHRRAKGEITVPLILEEEIATNPFLRWDVPSVCEHYNSAPGLETFERIVAASG